MSIPSNTSSISVPDEAAFITLVSGLQAAQAIQYVSVSSLMLIIWDILTNLEDEIEICIHRPFRLPAIVYIVCRIASLGYISVQAIYAIDNEINCILMSGVLEPIFFFLSNNSISLLFLLRVHAVFHDKSKVKLAFNVLWVLALSSEILDFYFVQPIPSMSTVEHCAYRPLQAVFSSLSILMALVFDTSVYFAISCRLFLTFRFATPETCTLPQKASSFFSGKYLPAFSRSLLRDGQSYYM
ncbi:hypothetical protein D9758_004435 [Tetrapyrgos nigripes]|uniref:DUF6533 domain-containing protein n=1 Tax=Tetrapyrgos nigripes TaxID=182062 RepID=A0A8H5GNV2_9AGAR|nr:hypothetical protein D9758_004435 [Tetrapyrgos nigripes]